MTDEEEFDATAAMADDEASGAADEPAVSPEALMEMPDAPERWDDAGEIIEPGAQASGEERKDHAASSAEAAAADGGAEASS